MAVTEPIADPDVLTVIVGAFSHPRIRCVLERCFPKRHKEVFPGLTTVLEDVFLSQVLGVVLGIRGQSAVPD